MSSPSPSSGSAGRGKSVRRGGGGRAKKKDNSPQPGSGVEEGRKVVQVPRIEDEEVDGFIRVLVRVLMRERLRQHIGQEELARRAGVSRSAVSLLESGARDPGMGMALRVGEALGGIVPILHRAQSLWLRYRFRAGRRHLWGAVQE